MKKVEACIVENCIPTPSSCVDWNGGDIKSLGICNGDSLNNVILEIVDKIEEIAGEDLSSFDIDALLEICSQKAPLEVNLTSILNVLKVNDICLKDYIDTLSEQIAELSTAQGVNVNLKCFADFDNLGNSLSITREQLDQLVIDTLCNHRQRITNLEGEIVSLHNEIDNLDTSLTVEELSIATCVNPAVLPTSQQVVNTSEAFCELEDATGTPADIASAIANVPPTDNANYGLITGWILDADNQAKVINNLLLKVANLEARILFMEETCCKATCDEVELGFTALMNEDGDGVIIRFTSGAGTFIPTGFEDKGSSGTITDKNGTKVTFNIDIVDNFNNDNETEVSVTGLDLTEKLTIKITSKIGTDALTCQSCIDGQVSPTSACDFCTLTATGDEGSTAVIVYEEFVVTT